jgi:hypothetical protein
MPNCTPIPHPTPISHPILTPHLTPLSLPSSISHPILTLHLTPLSLPSSISHSILTLHLTPLSLPSSISHPILTLHLTPLSLPSSISHPYNMSPFLNILSHFTPISRPTPTRYYGIAIVNSQGKKLKMPRGAVTVTYQIHRCVCVTRTSGTVTVSSSLYRSFYSSHHLSYHSFSLLNS